MEYKVSNSDYIAVIKIDDNKIVDVVSEIVNFMVKHERYSGEAIAQSDKCQLEASPLIEHIVDKYLDIKVIYS